jgi:uncharacterized RDD family membrane protein YckC
VSTPLPTPLASRANVNATVNVTANIDHGAVPDATTADETAGSPSRRVPPAASGKETAPESAPVPGLRRRLACFLYEGVLLFGVLMVSGLLFSGLTDQRNAMFGRHPLQAFLFVVLAIYFTWFWSHSGQTVAMKTWHIRLVDRHGLPVSEARAFARYVASWIWFMPVLALLYFESVKSLAAIFTATAVGVLAYAVASLLNPTRQYWHDALCGTQLITHRPALSRKPG